MRPEIAQRIVKAIQDISFGSVTLVFQDGKLIQMEKMEKIRFCEEKKGSCSQPKPDFPGIIESRIRGCLSGLQYGQVVINVRGGSIAQIERIEKKRYLSLHGVDGEGI